MLFRSSADDIAGLAPDFAALAALDRFAVIATAPGPWAQGDGVDFVSRFFAPARGVDEDPVTGSSHCTLIPYWAARLGKDRLEAPAVAPRRRAVLRAARRPGVDRRPRLALSRGCDRHMSWAEMIGTEGWR